MRGNMKKTDNELTFIDLISIISFIVGLENLDLNVNQEDMDAQTRELDKRLRDEITDIHAHLSVQDSKLNVLINEIEEMKNGSKRHF